MANQRVEQSTGTSSSPATSFHENQTNSATSMRRNSSNGLRIRRVDSMEAEANKVKAMEGNRHGNEHLPWSVTLLLAYQTIGVIFGDIGTSPLYVYASTFVDHVPSKSDVLGSLSIIIYTFTLIPLVKYVFIVLYANDHGNGGTFALYSLIARFARFSMSPNQIPEDQELSSYSISTPSRTLKRSQAIKAAFQKHSWLRNTIVTVAMCGTCMVLADGVLTPSISVLSAMSGIKVNNPDLDQNVVVIVSCVILFILFNLQRFGTDKVGYMFSPVVILWLLSIAVVGLYNIVTKDPSVFKAFNPYYIYSYFARNQKEGWISLGGIVLCITGTEAMYADLGHFSVRSVQIAFSTLAYPCLLIAYIGQAAYLLEHPEEVSETFYKSIPDAVYWPVFVVATGAAIIASQAMISATFSVINQAMTLGCFPRIKVIHTSSKYAGQIYIPELNWLMMVLCIAIAAGFGDTTQIANAYGVAVVSVFCITTHFVTLISILIWQVPLWAALLGYVIIGSVELTYLSAILSKVPKGGWVPLLFVGVFFSVMYTWYYGRKVKYEYELKNKVSLDWMVSLGSNLGIARLPGIGLIYSELAQGVPIIFTHLINNLPAMHSILVFVCIKNLPVPNISSDERFLIRRVGPKQFRIFRCAVRYGYRDYDVRQDVEFEKQLMEVLVKYLQTETNPGQEMLTGLSEGSDRDIASGFRVDMDLQDQISAGNVEVDGGSDPISTNLGLVPRKSVEFSVSASPPEGLSLAKQGSMPHTLDSSVQEELALLETSRAAGVVYLLGSTEIQARKDSSRVRRFIIDHYYTALKKNCRASTHALHIPHERLVKVGMIHSI